MNQRHLVPIAVFLLALSLARAEALKLDDTPRIAIVGAYADELANSRAVIDGETIEATHTINGIRFELGTAYGRPVLFFFTNTSTINAAMSTQVALLRFNVTHLLFAGIAGGIDHDLEKGDVAIPEGWAYHAQGAYFNPDPEEPESYLVPDRRYTPYPNFGMHHPSNVRVVRDGLAEAEPVALFPADPALLAIARDAVGDLDLTDAYGEPATIAIRDNGVAGPVFMDNAEYREFVHHTWNATVLDMESTAIGHVCWANQVPFLIIRSVSDLAGGQQGHNEIFEHADRAEANAARVLDAILRELASSEHD
ncbi:MAG: 5'-methylthioadenosine/S-adenosylhomocysteine nucleosidase [Opitutales bacterium]